MSEEEFKEIKNKAVGFRHSSMQYIDYDSVKECAAGWESADHVGFLGAHDGVPQLHWAADSLDALLAMAGEIRPLYIEFIPEEWLAALQDNGFQLISEFCDFFRPLMDDIAECEAARFMHPGEEMELHRISMECKNQSRGFLGEQEAFFREWLEQENGAVIVSEEDGKPAGFCCVATYGGEGNRTLWVREIAVRPGCQGRGYAKKMLGQALCFGKAHGAAKAFLMADVMNLNAIGLYERLGFMRKDGRGQINIQRG